MAKVSALGFALVVLLATWQQARAEEPGITLYDRMAPIDQYLMTDRNAEIAMARSAAPASISNDAEVLVLGRHGYETAVKGSNGFVCIVERAWTSAYDDPAFFNPTVREPICYNPPAAKSHLQLTLQRTEWAMAGMSKTQIFDAMRAAFERKELPPPETGAMCYMMSKQTDFGPVYGHGGPHLMFYFPRMDGVTWGAELPGSPVIVHQDTPEPVTVFVIPMSKWADGTAAPADGQ
ncbi:MAG: hypothetical protein WAL32_05535 [Terriglobales bacterium]